MVWYLPTGGWSWVLAIWWARPQLGIYLEVTKGSGIGSLLADEWHYILASLVFDLRHPSTDSYCWMGPIPGLGANEPRWQLPAAMFTEVELSQILPPVFMSPGWPQSPPQKTGRPACKSGPGTCQITVFVLGASVCEISCVPFMSGVSISSSPTGFLKLRSAGFKAKYSKDLSS